MSKNLITMMTKYQARINKFRDSIPFDCFRGFGNLDDVFHVSSEGFGLTQEGDHLTIAEWRACFSWWVEQLGGKVEWAKEDVQES